jgi:CMP-N,N'-diacetyllegionaminic acid synthase
MPADRVPVIILARGGSKAIPGKNLIDFCGRPLLEWTVDFALHSASALGVWVSTDAPSIADVAMATGAEVIERPAELSTDTSSSESGWLHAVDYLMERGVPVDTFAALQPTSPLRLPQDLDRAVDEFVNGQLDSSFSGSHIDDLTLWEYSADRGLVAVNHDPASRAPRQSTPNHIVENGSLYLMKTRLLRSERTRFAGRVGYSENRAWQAMEIDSTESLRVCEVLMRAFVLE